MTRVSRQRDRGCNGYRPPVVPVTDRLMPDRLAATRQAAAAIAATCVRMLPVDGAAILLMTDRTRWSVEASTSAEIAVVEDLQLTTGEGPSVEAYVTGGPVLAPDLTAASARWPALATVIERNCAFFSFPMRIGAVRLGVLDLHRNTPGPLAGPAMADALRLAAAAAATLIDPPGDEADGDGGDGDAAGPDPRIDRATGMTSVHLGVDIATAYARLRGHAFSTGRPLAEVAAAVVAGSLRLERGFGAPTPPTAEPDGTTTTR